MLRVDSFVKLSHRHIGLIFLIILMSAFYVWTVTSSPPPEAGGGYYGHLARSLAQGNLDLGIAPRPELLALPDPYDPIANAPLRLHDASLFEGKYYLYFGVTPAVTLFLPSHILGIEMSEPIAAAIFAALAFFFAALLVRRLLHHYARGTPNWWAWLAIAGLGLANIVPFLLRRPEFYEVAIASGLCFSTLCVLLAVHAHLGDRHGMLALAGSGLALGAAIGSRPHLAMIGIIPIWVLIRMARRSSIRETWRPALAFSAPLGVSLLLLGLYNWARFGSFTEFGATYQLAGVDMRTFDRFELSRLWPGTFFYYLSPPAFGTLFPFVALAPTWPGGGVPAGYINVELVGGVLPLIPLLVAGPIGGVWLALRGRTVHEREGGKVAVLLVAVGALVSALPIVLIPSATQRYEADWVTLMLIAATLAVGILLARPRRVHDVGRRALAVVATAAVLYSSLVGVALGLTGYYDWLRAGQPETFNALEDFLSPIPVMESRMRGEPIVQRLTAYAPGTYEIQITADRTAPVEIAVIPAVYPEGSGTTYRVRVSNDSAHTEGTSLRTPAGSPATARISVFHGINRMSLVLVARTAGGIVGTPPPVLDLTRVSARYVR